MKRAFIFVAFPLTTGACLPPCCPEEHTYDAPLVTELDDGGLPIGDAGFTDAGCAASCRYGHFGATVHSCSRSDLGVHCVTTVPCEGRRPQEWVRGSAQTRDLVGAWLADVAQLEAASVPAFEILAAELRAHDAPPALIARALASADDERRHARIMTSLARSYGATPGPVRVIVREPRALEAIARENAVEGLVREAYGARVAIDPAIAADEERHAALAADVHAWIRPRLSYAARLRVDEARDAARAQLVAECAIEPAPELRDVLGLPDATRAVELARRV